MASLYVGQKVNVKSGGKIISGEVLEIAGNRFCIRFEDGDTRWIAVSAVVSDKPAPKKKRAAAT